MNTVRRNSLAALRRVRHARHPALRPRPQNPPERPVGAKLELTHRCNLLCSFCYTDSPTRTLLRPPELDAEAWLQVIDQVIDLGVVEAVLTGGEPLLRKDLTLEAARRLSNAGIGVILNTNGWFVDDRFAREVTKLAGVKVSVSIDGIAESLHDGGRGVGGSWRKAIEGANRILAHGGDLRVVHVVLPTNQAHVEPFIQAMIGFGVRSLRVVGAASDIGAAARGGDWTLDNRELARTVHRYRDQTRSQMTITYIPTTGATVLEQAPSAFLVRPDGALVLDSRRPIRFGTIPADLAAAWQEVRTFWASDGPSGLEHRMRGHVAYRDTDVAATNGTDTVAAVSAETAPAKPAPVPVGLSARRSSAEPARTIPVGLAATLAGPKDVSDGRAFVAALVLARRYRTVPLRWAGDRDGFRNVRSRSGTKHNIDARAGALLDEFESGALLGEALSNVAARTGATTSSLQVIANDLIRRQLLAAVPLAGS